MLNQPTFEKLVQMRLGAMAQAFHQQTEDPNMANLSFEERFGMLVDAEYWSRHNNRLKRNIHNACLEQPQASLADINYTSGRILDKELIQALGTGQYIREQHNVIILGATGSGKTYLGCALGMEACKQGFTVKYVRLPELLEIIHARHKRASTIFCSQFEPIGWLGKFPEASIADAVLDRIIHDSYTIEIRPADQEKQIST